MSPLAARKDVRILLVGERNVGKTSLILSLVSEEFPEEVPPRAEEITIPADVTPEQVPTHIVDFSEGEQSETDLMKQLGMADVVCVVYAVDDDASLKQVTNRWLPLIRKARAINSDGSAKNGEEEASIPVILVGNKLDLIDQGTMEVLLPIMNQYAEIETCVECSARTLRNVSELFYYAQKAVLHPIGPLYIVDEKELTDKCKKALTRIFKICDRDGDNALNDVELNAFQSRCFGTALQPRALEDVRAVVRRSLPDGVDDRGLTLKGFLFLHCLFIQRGRHETTWTVLRKFGYDDHLQLSRDYLFPQLRVPPGCSTELSNAGINFLTEIFLRHDVDKDRSLNPRELESLFSPCPVIPWGRDLQHTVVTNRKGWVTLEGFLAQWALTTLLDVRRTCELLAYLGYHTAGEDSQLSAIHVTRDKKIDLAKRQTTRQVFMCHVIGPKGAGKSTFCQAMLGKSVEDFNSLSFAELPRYVAGMIPVYGQQKYMVLQDIDVISLADTLSPAQVHCDVACLLYNAADPRSFEHVARLYLKYFAESKTPVLIVGSQTDRSTVRQEYLVQPEAFCRRHRIPPPQPFASTGDHTQDIFIKLATMAVFPHWRQMGFKNLPVQTWLQAAVGLAAVSAFGFFILRAYHRFRV